MISRHTFVIIFLAMITIALWSENAWERVRHENAQNEAINALSRGHNRNVGWIRALCEEIDRLDDATCRWR